MPKTADKEQRRHPFFRRFVTITGAIGVTVVIVIGFGVIPAAFTFSSRSCALCHATLYHGWETTTHKNVPCSSCHIQRTFLTPLGLIQKMLIELKVRDSKEALGFVARTDNKVCDSCHKARRTISPGGDLLIPHTAHTKLRKLACVDCHTNLVHRGKSTKKTKPSMITCYKCHDGKKAPNSCGVCHTEKSLPPDHKGPEWLASHSQVHDSDPDYCIGCHGWVEDYCGECHKRKPRSHLVLGWRSQHQNLFVTDRRAGCSQCHGEKCNSCHGKSPFKRL